MERNTTEHSPWAIALRLAKECKKTGRLGGTAKTKLYRESMTELDDLVGREEGRRLFNLARAEVGKDETETVS